MSLLPPEEESGNKPLPLQKRPWCRKWEGHSHHPAGHVTHSACCVCHMLFQGTANTA